MANFSDTTTLNNWITDQLWFQWVLGTGNKVHIESTISSENSENIVFFLSSPKKSFRILTLGGMIDYTGGTGG